MEALLGFIAEVTDVPQDDIMAPQFQFDRGLVRLGQSFGESGEPIDLQFCFIHTVMSS